MICREANTIFVHIPKTGGQSICEAIMCACGYEWQEDNEHFLMRGNDDPARGPARLGHLYAREYVDCGYVTAEQWRDAFSFAVIRNPYDRLISEYRFHHQWTFMTFDGWLECAWPHESMGMHDHRRHVEPQWRFVCDEHGKQIVDRIVRYENMNEEVPRILQDLFGCRIELPRRNPGLGNPVQHTPYTIDFCNRVYAEDFEMFGYQRLDA